MKWWVSGLQQRRRRRLAAVTVTAALPLKLLACNPLRSAWAAGRAKKCLRSRVGGAEQHKGAHSARIGSHGATGTTGSQTSNTNSLTTTELTAREAISANPSFLTT